MNRRELKTLLRRGRNNKTIFIVYSYVSTYSKVRKSAKPSTIICVPLHVLKQYVEVELLASEEPSIYSASNTLLNRYYASVDYNNFDYFRKWTVRDGPLTVNFLFMSPRYREIAFNAYLQI